jgi:hypothetical protein
MINQPDNSTAAGDRRNPLPPAKNILLLYDEKVIFINTVREHVEAFKRFSRNNVFFAPGTVAGAVAEDAYVKDRDFASESWEGWNLNIFDAVVIHSSVRLSIKGYISASIVDMLKAYDGPKILFVQDEYEGVGNLRRYIKELGVQHVYTCVPPEWHEFAYPRALFPGIELISTLTGYAPDEAALQPHIAPLRDRKILIGYRGRRLPHHYGLLGHEKFIIGERVREAAIRRGLSVDIENDDSKRIYGSWYAFLGGCRATLGSESGSNIFDFDDSLRKKALELADLPFEAVYDEHFRAHEGPMRMNQISPKFFEAIALRTALVCFPGSYSGILQPDRHYIPLERDFSNLDDVFERLADIDYLERLTTAAYEDIIESGKYDYPAFISEFDNWLDARVSTPRFDVISVPVAVRRGDEISLVHPGSPTDYLLTDHVLGGDWQRGRFRALFEEPALDQLRLENRATLGDGASIRDSTPFFQPPHDAERLLRPAEPDEYSAAQVYAPAPQFIDIDLGTEHALEGALFEWLDSVNYAVDYRLYARTAANIWSLILDVKDSSALASQHVFPRVRARIFRLVATRFSDQQRLLIRRLELYEANPIEKAVEMPRKRARFFRFFRQKLRR